MSTINGFAITQATISHPFQGAWHARVTANSATDITGTTNINIEGVLLIGTVVRGAVDDGLWTGLVVGGSGGLATQLPSKSYTRTFGRVIVADVLASIGETLASDTDTGLQSKFFEHWLRAAGTGGETLDQIAAARGLSWWVTDTGRIKFGTQTFAVPTNKHIVVSKQDGDGTITIQSDVPFVRPGHIIDGKKIVAVETKLESGKLRSECLVQMRDGGSDFFSLVKRIVTKIVKPLDYYALYACVVQSQDPTTGKVAVVPNDPRIPAQPNVTIRHGLPGVSVKVSNGAKALLGFENGNPEKPFVSLWDASSVEIVLAPTTLRLGSASATDRVVTQSRLQSALDAVVLKINTHIHTGVTAGVAASGVATPPVDGVNATGSPGVQAD